MSKDKEKQDKPQYDLEEILAEYGSGKYSNHPKVVEFPESSSFSAQAERHPPSQSASEPRANQPAEGEKTPSSPAEERPILNISPKGLGRHIGARLSTWLRRADHFADHMYDQAEPDEAVLKAERYLPGTDREEVPAEGAVPHSSRTKRPAKLPPDTPPAQLAVHCGKGLKAQRRRLLTALVLALLTLLPSLLPHIPPWSVLEGVGLSAYQFCSLLLTALLLAVGLLCHEIPAAGLKQLVSLHPGAQSVTLLAWLFTLLDGVTAGRLEPRYSCLPCAAITAFGLVFSLWGEHVRRQADRLSAKTASHVRSPYVVSLDENKWNGRPAFTKWSGSSVGFGSQLQMDDGVRQAYRIAAPLLILGGLLCALLASIGRGAPWRFPWAASTCLTAAAAWSSLLAYALPYRKLTVRLGKVGAALAGWPGASRCIQAGILMSDLDLFPTGSVSVTQVNVFGGVATEKVVAYTATLMRVMDCGLTRPFHDLLRTQGAIYREVSGVRYHEGGVSGVIHNQEVLVGTAAFMHLMDIPMPAGHNVRNAIFCAIGGQLCGLFPLNYHMDDTVNPSLTSLLSVGISPVLATRDPNLIPAMLERKFKLPVDKMDFPPVERRIELSQRDQDHNDVPVALLAREGLRAYCDAVVGGRRLRQATWWSLIFTLTGAVVGLCLTFYLTSMAAFASLTTLNFLVFMLAWLVPELIIANWVHQC